MLNQPKVPALGVCTKSVKHSYFPLLEQSHIPGCRKIPSVVLLPESESHLAMVGSCGSAHFLLARVELLCCAISLCGRVEAALRAAECKEKASCSLEGLPPSPIFKVFTSAPIVTKERKIYQPTTNPQRQSREALTRKLTYTKPLHSFSSHCIWVCYDCCLQMN